MVEGAGALWSSRTPSADARRTPTAEHHPDRAIEKIGAELCGAGGISAISIRAQQLEIEPALVEPSSSSARAETALAPSATS
jgi:hypothetical protein